VRSGKWEGLETPGLPFFGNFLDGKFWKIWKILENPQNWEKGKLYLFYYII